MPSKPSGTSSTNTVTQQSSPPPQIMANYENVYNQAAGLPAASAAAGLPTVAPLNQQQMNAVGATPYLAAGSTPYLNAASNLYGSATAPLYSDVNNYMSPYIGDVVNATEQQFNNQNAIQQTGVQGNAVAQGAWGGDRSAVAQGIVAGQQQANEAPVIAGLYNTGYGTALNAAETQGWLGLQGAAGLSNLGQENFNIGAGTLGAELQGGALVQNEQQALLNAPYQQTGWLANIAEGLGGASGGTSSTQYPSPSALSQAAGLGIGGLGILGSTGAFGSSGYLTGAGGLLNFSGAVPAAASILGLPAATSGDALASASLSAALRRGGGIPHRDSGGGIANDLSEAAGYGANGSGILASAGGSGGILQDLSDPTSSAGAGLLTALSLRRGGWVPHRDGGGGIVPGAGPFGMPGSSPMPVSLQVMALPQHGMPGNPIVGGPPRPPNAPPSSWGSTYANPNDYGGMLSGLAHSIHSSGIMGQRRGGLVRRADGGGGIMPPNMLAPPTGDDANTFVIDASAAPQAGAAPSVAGFWTQHGATPAAAQGIQAAAESESGLNPGAPGDNGTSLGLYQHHGPRLDALKDYAATQGGSPTDPNIQNQFALSEVNGGDPLATKHWDEIKSQTDPGKAQALWEKYFERPGLASRSASVQPQGIAPSAPAFMGQVTDTGEPSMGAGPASMGPPPAPSEMDRLNMPGTDPWLALAAAGFGMASGTSPFAAANIGRGAEAGINFLEQERQMLPEQRLRTAQAEQAEVTAGLTEAQLDYYANHGINTLNGNLALAGKALTGAGAGQISATNGGVSQAPSMMTLPNAGVPVPTGGEANPQFQQLDEAYRQLDFLAGAPMLPAQKAQIIEQIARLRDTDPRVAAAKAGMAAQAQVAPHIQEAGGKKAAELGSTITMSRDGTMYLGTQPIWTSAIPRPYVTSAAEATPTDPEGTPHEGFRARPMPIPVGGQQPAGGGIAPVPGSPAAIAIPNPPSALAAPHQANPNAPIGADWQTGLSPEALGHAEEAGKTRGEEEQKDRQETIEGGVAAQQQQAILSRLKDDAPQFTQGPFAGHVQAVNTYLRAMFGTQVPQVASYEDFIKNAGALTRAAVRETSSRAAVQEFKLIDATLPSPDMSPQGLNQVVNEYQGLNDYKIAKVQAQQAWEQQHGGTGNVQGFETDFQAKVSPYAFVFNRMDPDEQRGLVSRMRATSAGRAELGHLAQQLQYAKNAGLEPQ